MVGRLILCVCAFSILIFATQGVAQTKPASEPSDVKYRLALVSDPHVSGDRRFSSYIENFEQVIDQVNAAGVDAVVLSGDLMQSFNPEAAAKFKEMVKRFRAPARFVPGNHDIGDKCVTTKPATVSEARVDQYVKHIGEPYFSEEILPGVRLIGIASSLFETALPREQAQWEFLERELDRPRDGVTLVLTHYPPFVSTPDEADEYFNINAPARARLLALLKRGGATAVLSGHLHRPVLLEWQGIPIIGAPAVSFGLPEGEQPVGWRLVSLHRDGQVTSALRYLEPRATTRPAPGTELLRSSKDRIQ